jgi:hypothetical protein
MNIKDFVEKATDKHQGKYQYSETIYKNAKTKVEIKCEEHGIFTQLPSNHLRGRGCPKCSLKNSAEKYSFTKEEFTQKAKEVHSDRYDYTKVDYKNSKTKVEIICKTHGIFKQIPFSHLKGSGCMKCHKDNTKWTKESFIKKSVELHGTKYNYSKVQLTSKRSKAIIICPVHGEFTQAIETHLRGSGCKKCADKNRQPKTRLTTDIIIKRFKKAHGNKYNYSQTKYEKANKKVKIECENHGMFEQSIYNHQKGAGCPKCANKKLSKSKTDTEKEFLEKAKEIHKEAYNYSLVNYVKSKENVSIVCKKHGLFYQRPNSHLNGAGCPKCAWANCSRAESELYNFIGTYITAHQSDRIILERKELDIVIPSKKIAIEFNGLHWHSDKRKDNNFHLLKTNAAKNKGYRLIHIFEDEWMQKKEIVKSRLLNIIGKTVLTLYARKCSIKEVSVKEKSKFLQENHLQGKVGGQVNVGLYYEQELVSIMTFGKLRKNLGQTHKQGHWELLRFCNKINTNVVGGASKLLKYFVNSRRPENIISYADRRWSEGDLYLKLGFKEQSISEPNYFYTKSEIRENRFKYRKSELVKQGFDPMKTERQIMTDRGYNRIYDCGAIKFKLTLL